jgi:hypothetical protein
MATGWRSTPALRVCLPGGPEPTVRDEVRDYIAHAQQPFDDLRDAASQIAGLLVLAASGARSAGAPHPMLAVASQRWREASDAAHSLPAPPAARHHHFHLIQAAELLGEALDGLNERGLLGARSDSALDTVKRAWAEIVHAANALPGFATVDFGQACCAPHARLREKTIAAQLGGTHV